MEFLELKKLLYDCTGKFKTRQQLWHFCINRIKAAETCLEFGVWHGGSINYFANALPDTSFVGFDSFEGLPENWIVNHPKGHFKVADQSKLRFAKNISLQKGWFNQTLPSFLGTEGLKKESIKFIHIDCDLGSSTDTVLSLLKNEIVGNKCLLLFDEFYNYRGFENHEFLSFLNFVNTTGVSFEILGRNIHHQQALIQIL